MPLTRVHEALGLRELDTWYCNRNRQRGNLTRDNMCRLAVRNVTQVLAGQPAETLVPLPWTEKNRPPGHRGRFSRSPGTVLPVTGDGSPGHQGRFFRSLRLTYARTEPSAHSRSSHLERAAGISSTASATAIVAIWLTTLSHWSSVSYTSR